MARSLKKGPFADAHLLKKVDALNAASKTEVIKCPVSALYAERRQNQQR